jgi:hypothetical protein
MLERTMFATLDLAEKVSNDTKLLLIFQQRQGTRFFLITEGMQNCLKTFIVTYNTEK